MAVRNIKLTIAYDGSDYHGWQIQPGLKTVQGLVAEAINELLGCKIRVIAASRTDAGVSALGQVALIQIDSPIPVENLAEAITHKLPHDVAITDAVEVPLGFDVIGAVKSKLYRYTIFTGPTRPVLRIRHCWHLPAELDTVAMKEAAKILVGKKDFKSFASAADNRESTVRTIFRCDVTREGDLVYVDIEGDGFLYNMARNIVGTLVEVGLGKRSPKQIKQVLQAENRTAAGQIAPAAGLCLMWIKY
jgi:tRNA pseudouridine38-40 synthase